MNGIYMVERYILSEGPRKGYTIREGINGICVEHHASKRSAQASMRRYHARRIGATLRHE